MSDKFKSLIIVKNGKKLDVTNVINKICIVSDIEEIYPTVEIEYKTLNYSDIHENLDYIVIKNEGNKENKFIPLKVNYHNQGNTFFFYIKAVDIQKVENLTKGKIINSPASLVFTNIGNFKNIKDLKNVNFQLGYMNADNGLNQLKSILNVNIFKQMFTLNTYYICKKNDYTITSVNNKINIDVDNRSKFKVLEVYKNNLGISFRRYDILNDKTDTFYINSKTKQVSKTPENIKYEEHTDFHYSDSLYIETLNSYNSVGNNTRVFKVDFDLSINPLDYFMYDMKNYVVIKAIHNISNKRNEDNTEIYCRELK